MFTAIPLVIVAGLGGILFPHVSTQLPRALLAAPNSPPAQEQDGMDFAATTVKLPDGEYVPSPEKSEDV